VSVHTRRTQDITRYVRQQVYDDILRELRAETYFGLVRLSKPGCRTICILVNEENKDKLLRQFRNCVWPWRKYVRPRTHTRT
jgi:hypothetical protein